MVSQRRRVGASVSGQSFFQHDAPTHTFDDHAHRVDAGGVLIEHKLHEVSVVELPEYLKKTLLILGLAIGFIFVMMVVVLVMTILIYVNI